MGSLVGPPAGDCGAPMAPIPRTPLREAAGQVAAAATVVLVVWLAFTRAAGGRS